MPFGSPAPESQKFASVEGRTAPAHENSRANRQTFGGAQAAGAQRSCCDGLRGARPTCEAVLGWVRTDAGEGAGVAERSEEVRSVGGGHDLDLHTWD